MSKSAKNAVAVETNETVVETADNPVVGNNSQLSTVQESILQDDSTSSVDPTLAPVDGEVIEPSTPPTVAELKLMAENGDMEFEEFEQMVVDGKLSREDFAEILGVDYEDDETSTTVDKANPTIGHNKPPVDATASEVAEELRQYKPLMAVTSAEALEHVKAALTDTVEYISQGDTSLTSKGAIAIADYVSFNAGMADNGNKLITVNSGMYRQLLDNLSAMVPSEDADQSFRTRVGNMIKRAILLMDGKIQIGYFVLPADRKAVRANDEALPEYPTDLQEGQKVIRSTCIYDGVLTPRIPVEHKGSIVSYIDNSASVILRLLSNEATNAKYEALWDKDGEIVYHPVKGHILGFKSGKQLADDKQAETAKKEREKLDAANADKARRQTGGSQEGKTTAEQAQEKIAEQANTIAEYEAALTKNVDSIERAFTAIGAYIKNTDNKIPETARCTFWDDANSMLRRRVVDAKQVPSDQEMLCLTRLLNSLEAVISWNDAKGTWKWQDANGNLVREYTLNGEKAA